MRTESQTDLQCWEAEFLVHLQNLKVIKMSRTLLLLVLTLAFVFVSRVFGSDNDEDLKSDYLTWKWHPN